MSTAAGYYTTVSSKRSQKTKRRDNRDNSKEEKRAGQSVKGYKIPKQVERPAVIRTKEKEIQTLESGLTIQTNGGDADRYKLATTLAYESWMAASHQQEERRPSMWPQMLYTRD